MDRFQAVSARGQGGKQRNEIFGIMANIVLNQLVFLATDKNFFTLIDFNWQCLSVKLK